MTKIADRQTAASYYYCRLKSVGKIRFIIIIIIIIIIIAGSIV